MLSKQYKIIWELVSGTTTVACGPLDIGLKIKRSGVWFPLLVMSRRGGQTYYCLCLPSSDRYLVERNCNDWSQLQQIAEFSPEEVRL